MKHSILLALTLSLFSLSTFGQGTWTIKADLLGTARAAAIGLSTSTHGYIGFGYNNGNYFPDLWEYNPVANAWTQKAAFPGTYQLMGFGFSLNNLLYYGGGTNGFGQPFNEFWQYNPATNMWNQKANCYPTGSLWYYNSATSSSGLGIVLNGNFMSIYDPVNNTWQNVPSLIPPRTNSISFGIGNLCYFGAGYQVSGPPLQDFWSFDPVSHTFTQVQNIPTQVIGQGTFVIGNRGYSCMGGNSSIGNINSLWCYDVNLNQWQQKANYPSYERGYTTGFSVNNKGYCGTGIDGGYFKDNYEYTPDSVFFTGIASGELKDEYNVFYSSAEQVIYIKAITAGLQSMKLDLYDVKGSCLPFERKNNDEIIELKLTSFDNGICFLKMTSANRSFTRKLWIAH